jgi:hypothetical protein
VGELEREFEACLARSGAVRLELSGVNFADEVAARILLRLQERGASLDNCSGFLSWLLDKREGV